MLPPPDLSARSRRLVIALLSGIVAAVTAVQIVSPLMSSSLFTTPRALVSSILPSVMPVATVTGGLLLAMVVLAGMRGGRAALAASFVLVSLALLAVWTWDARSGWVQFSETAQQPSLTSASEAVTLVEDTSLGFYSLFGRPVYFSVVLGAGVVFSRDLALEYEEHRSYAALINFAGSDERIIQLRGDVDPPKRTSHDLIALCERPGAPTTLLLRVAATDAPGIEWIPPNVPDGAARLEDDGITPSDRFFRYECSDILRSKPSSD